MELRTIMMVRVLAGVKKRSLPIMPVVFVVMEVLDLQGIRMEQ